MGRIQNILEIETELRALTNPGAPGTHATQGAQGTKGSSEIQGASGGPAAGQTAKPSRELLLRAKQAGFSDQQIALCVKSREDKIRALRKEFALRPVIKQIDTVSAEIPTKGGFLYMTYSGVTDDVKASEKGALVLGRARIISGQESSMTGAVQARCAR